MQLVHSSLLQLADRDQAAKERRIENIMQKIDNAHQMTGRFYRIAMPFVRYGIAAVLIISVVILFTQLQSNTAMAAIDRMIATIDHAGDRTYSIIVEDNKTDSHPLQQDERHPEKRIESGERALLDGATLYLRDGGKFVLSQKTPSGRTVISGSDGQTRWHIRPDKPVLVSNNPQAFRIPMPPELEAILSLDLKTTLQKIRAHYKFKYFEDTTGGKKQDSCRTYLNAQKLGRYYPGPKNIEILADSKTGLLLRIEFADIHLEDDPTPKKMIIELIRKNFQMTGSQDKPIIRKMHKWNLYQNSI